MASTIKSTLDGLLNSYQFYLTKRDERVMYWPLLERPDEMMYLIIGYLIFIIVGKRVMANQKPFELKYPLIIHNFSLLLISAYIVIETLRQAYINNYTLVCNPVDYSDNGIGMARVLWLFFFSKSIELMDTVFMVLRKKFDQVSFLHVYHHSTIFILWWIGTNWTPGGDAYLSAAINSLIHTIMYLYYLLAAIKVDVWWKRYLTQLQLLQFFVNLFSSVYAIYTPGCIKSPQTPDHLPIWMHYGMLIYMFSMIFLFGSFYIRSYINKKSRPSRGGSSSQGSKKTTTTPSSQPIENSKSIKSKQN